MLLPKDSDDEKNAILEVRADTGGDEAALFAAVLFEMYQHLRCLKYAILHLPPSQPIRPAVFKCL